jgi:hypothetical protein
MFDVKNKIITKSLLQVVTVFSISVTNDQRERPYNSEICGSSYKIGSILQFPDRSKPEWKCGN